MSLRPLFIRSAAALGAVGLVISASSPASTAVQTIDGGASATATADRNEAPERMPNRPGVYLAYHGSEGFLGNTDQQWPYVRANLDGFWGNWFVANPDTQTSLNRTIELTRKVETRDLIVEHPIVEGGRCIGFRDDFYESEVERLAPDIRFVRRAAAIYAGPNPDCWGAVGGIDAAFGEYGQQGYASVYAFYQPQNLSSSVNSGSFPTIQPGSSGDNALRRAGGVAVECPLDACTDPSFGAPFLQAIRDARARGVPFVWFTGFSTSYNRGRSGWLQSVQSTYNMVAAEGLWRADDAIVLINYEGAYPSLPERNANGAAADTTAGVLYWLLNQRPF